MTTSQVTNCQYCGKQLEPLIFNGLTVAHKPCNCLQAREQASIEARQRMQAEEAARKASQRERLVRCGIGRVYVDAQAPVDLVSRAINHEGLYLYGNSGCGKTWAASAIARTLIEEGRTGRMITAGKLLRKIRAAYNGQGTEDEVVESMTARDFLVLDDLGAEPLKDWSASIVEAVIDQMEKDGRQLIVTSNYSLSDLGKHLANGSDTIQAMRIVSRIKGLTTQHDMSGIDRRRA